LKNISLTTYLKKYIAVQFKAIYIEQEWQLWSRTLQLQLITETSTYEFSYNGKWRFQPQWL